MNDQNETDVKAAKRRFPMLLLAGTVLLPLAYLAGNHFRDELSDGIFQFDFAILNFVTVGLAAILLVWWLCWLVFHGGSRFASRVLPGLIVVGGVAFLTFYRPIFTGGMGIDRWEPRFWDRELENVAAEGAADLSVPSPADFSGFLGSNRNGVIDNMSARLTSLEDLNKLYVKDVGNAWSGFAARNGFAITMEQRGEFECVTCYEIKSGTLVWKHQHPRRFDETLGQLGPRTTPTLDGPNVYAQGANGLLVCLNASTGELIWQQDVAKMLGIELAVATDRKGLEYQTEKTDMLWGRSGSPLVVDDLVVVPGDGPLEGPQVSLVAFNKLDGTEVWRAGEDGASYASPCLFELAGQRQIVSQNAATVTGHDVKAGSVLWSHDRLGHSDTDANTSLPIQVDNQQILCTKGYGLGAELIKVTKSNDGDFSVESVWQNRRVLKTKLTNAVVKDGYAYALSDGILECVDLETGKRVWKKGRFYHGQLLIVGEYLLVHSEHGKLNLIEATPDEYRLLESIDTIDGVCWNTFCAYDRYILLRSDIEMACFEISTNAGSDSNPGTEVDNGN